MNPLPDPPPLLNLIGEKVALGPRRRDLLPIYLRWINDYEVTRTLSSQLRPMTMEEEEKWWEQTQTETRKAAFTIYERETLRPIGNTDLFDIDHFHRTAVFGLMIGEKDCWGKGYGTEATRLMLEYGFTGQGLHNILLEVYSCNERAIRAYTRAGFREIGRRREAIRLLNRPYDIVLMDCLSTEFEGTALRHLVPDE
ncbi:MAG: GNAT family N-acetyltransferase [Armatimonadetes bacterium]|nr:GNAT family N-acetyltransferase [Armatimonadota bacterium]